MSDVTFMVLLGLFKFSECPKYVEMVFFKYTVHLGYSALGYTAISVIVRFF